MEQPTTTASSTVDPGAQHGKRLARVGIAADVLALVGVVDSFKRTQIFLLVLSVAAFLLVGSSVLWRRKTKQAVALLVAGCLVLAGCVAYKVADLFSPSTDTASAPATSAPATSAPLTSAPSTTSAAPSGSSSAAANGDEPRKLVDDTVILPRGAAVDVDHAGPTVATDHEDGAAGDYDLYHVWGQVVADAINVVNEPNVYTFPAGGSLTKGLATCKDTFSQPPLKVAGGGSTFCFRSSEGHPGFASIVRSREDHAFVVHVVVWDGQGA